MRNIFNRISDFFNTAPRIQSKRVKEILSDPKRTEQLLNAILQERGELNTHKADTGDFVVKRLGEVSRSSIES